MQHAEIGNCSAICKVEKAQLAEVAQSGQSSISDDGNSKKTELAQAGTAAQEGEHGTADPRASVQSGAAEPGERAHRCRPNVTHGLAFNQR